MDRQENKQVDIQTTHKWSPQVPANLCRQHKKYAPNIPRFAKKQNKNGIHQPKWLQQMQTILGENPAFIMTDVSNITLWILVIFAFKKKKRHTKVSTYYYSTYNNHCYPQLNKHYISRLTVPDETWWFYNLKLFNLSLNCIMDFLPFI